MTYLANLDDKDILFTWGLFGIQQDGLETSKLGIITTLRQLLSQSADCIDCLQDERLGPHQEHPKSTTFVAYWLDCKDYEAWKETILNPFWDALPDDAGVWREVMTVPKSRYMYATNQRVPSGLATMVGLKSSSDSGYWGVYRHRMSDTPDKYTTPGDTFSSPYISKSTSKFKAEKRVVNLERSFPSTVRKGRVKITEVPDNLCFIREQQSHADLEQLELNTWSQRLKPYFQSWVSHLDTERNKNGVVSFTTHIAHETRMIQDQLTHSEHTAAFWHSTSAISQANQLMYFLDLEHFELAGRSFRDHVQLRSATMELYGPNGKFGGGGKLHLVVEMCVLKSSDLDAEYIGCREGTGLMILEDV